MSVFVRDTAGSSAHINNHDVRLALSELGACIVAFSLLLALAYGLRDAVMGVIYSKDVTGFDSAVLHTVRGASNQITDGAFIVASWIGSPVAIVVWGIVGLVWLARRKELLAAATWMAAVGGSGALSVSLKHIFQRSRPPGATEFLHAVSFSFPSTHTVASLVTYGTLCYMLCSLVARDKSRRMLITVGLVTLVVTIAASRVVLGVHYFSDVCAGIVTGSIWLCICIAVHEYALGRRRLLA